MVSPTAINNQSINEPRMALKPPSCGSPRIIKIHLLIKINKILYLPAHIWFSESEQYCCVFGYVYNEADVKRVFLLSCGNFKKTTS